MMVNISLLLKPTKDLVLVAEKGVFKFKFSCDLRELLHCDLLIYYASLFVSHYAL